MDFDEFAIGTLAVARELAEVMAELAEDADPYMLMAALEILQRDLGRLWDEC